MEELLAHARSKLDAARVLLAAQAFGDAASRAYYGAFLFEDRQTGDYDPTASLEAAEATRDVAEAQRIVDAVAQHLGR